MSDYITSQGLLVAVDNRAHRGEQTISNITPCSRLHQTTIYPPSTTKEMLTSVLRQSYMVSDQTSDSQSVKRAHGRSTVHKVRTYRECIQPPMQSTWEKYAEIMSLSWSKRYICSAKVNIIEAIQLLTNYHLILKECNNAILTFLRHSII